MTDRDEVRRGYDGLAETYAAERSPGDRELSMLEDLLDRLDADARLLDAGCGQGEPILARAADRADATGLDFSGEQLRLAADSAPGASLLQGDMTALPFGPNSFDAVTAFHSLIHVPLSEHGPVIEEFARVLRPGGYLLASEGPQEWVGSNPDWLDAGAEMQWSIAGREATLSDLRSAGFEVLAERTDADELAEEDDGAWVFFLARLAG